LDDSDHDVREAAVEALGHLRSKLAVEALIPSLADAQSSIRRATDGALRRIDPEWKDSEAARKAIPALKARLNSRDYWVRQAAADVLGRIGDMRRAEPTLNSFTDPIHYKRMAALQAMLQMMTDWDADVRVAGAECLGRLGDARAAEVLTEALADRNEWVRTAAAAALQRMAKGNEGAGPHAARGLAESHGKLTVEG
jgi:HEAT repeat protein